MRFGNFGNGEAFGADKPIWAWLLRHAGWQISRYKQKGNGMTAFKQAYGEHHTHEVVPFAEVILGRIPKPTHRALQGGKRWHKGDAVFIKGVWVGRSETSDEHIVLTPGGRVLSRTIRRLEPSRRHDAGFLGKVKGLPWDLQDGIRHLFWSERTLRSTILKTQMTLTTSHESNPFE